MTALDRFDRAADAAASRVIASYSTSFGLAVRLLGPRHRQHVRNVYAMVRVADEIVDGVAAEAGLDPEAQGAALERYLQELRDAVRDGYSPDLVLHAFARTARLAGIDDTLIDPFFAAMRSDLAGERALDDDEHGAYVHGSAEVVGLMCLRIFVRDQSIDDARLATLENGARQLGAAFQNVNFLRDLGDDLDRLGRSYLDAGGCLDDAGRRSWVRTTREELRHAARTIPLLPRDTRAAVRSALGLFAALTDRVARTPVAELRRRRVRVPGSVKAIIVARACLMTWRERS